MAFPGKHRHIALPVILTLVAGLMLPPGVTGQTVGEVSIFEEQQAFDTSTLKPSSLRRLVFYSDKAREALFDLAKSDSLGGEQGAALAEKATRDLRKAIERLIDAGKKADLSLEQTAAFFAAELRKYYSGDFPFVVLDDQGQLNTALLFRDVEQARARGKAAGADDYLQMVLQTGEKAVSSVTPAQPDTPAPATPQPPVLSEPEVQRDPAVQAYWDRLVERNGKRYIEVIPGDTLAAFASAFYGDTLRYRVIFLANEGIIETPNLLEVGMVIEIPE